MTEMLSYDVFGKGPGLVLLHGTSSTGPGTWGTVLEQLAAEYTVILPNLPGSGDSPLPEGPLVIETIADQVIATAQAAGLSEFVVAGASLGAAVAVKVAARRPERVRGLVTIVGYARPRTTLRLNLELWASLHTRGDEDLGKFLVGLSFSESYLAALPPQAVQQVIEQFSAHPAPGTAEQIAFTLGIDVRDDLSAVRVPTLVVSAAEDRFVAPEHSVELADGIAGAHLLQVTGGHAAIFENPQQTLEGLAGFLKELT